MDNENKAAETEQQVDQEKTVKVAEMQRRLDKEKEKYEKEINELKEKQAEEIKNAIAEYDKQQKMDADELQKYQEAEAKRKHDEEVKAKDDQIAELLADKTRREIKDESIKKMGELNIPVNEATLVLVTADTFDDMKGKAEALADYTKALKNEYATATEPSISNSQRPKQSMYDILDSAKQTPI